MLAKPSELTFGSALAIVGLFLAIAEIYFENLSRGLEKFLGSFQKKMLP